MSPAALQTAGAVTIHRALGFPVSRELHLLLACAASEPPDRLRQCLEPDLDWDAFLELTDRHQLLPAVHRALTPLAADLPREISARLLFDVVNHTRRVLLLGQELLRATGALAFHGVEAILFKGPVLALSAYGDVAARSYSDLDILIRPRDFVSARTALVEAGYMPELQLRPEEESEWVETSYEMAFSHDELRNLVELQWALAPAFYGFHVDMEGLFARVQTIHLFGNPVRTLSPTDQLLTVAVHGGKHLWWQLRWLCDLAKSAAVPGVDWHEVRERAREWRVERMVRVGLHLAQGLLDADFPEEASRWVREDPSVEPISRDLAATIFAADEIPADSLAYFRWIARLRDSRSDRIRFFWKLAATPSLGEWSVVRLPKPLFPLYRVVRVARLLRRGVG